MARLFRCPRCGSKHAGVNRSEGSMSFVCNYCVVVVVAKDTGPARVSASAKSVRKAKRKKVSR